jgi:hypothetical protein
MLQWFRLALAAALLIGILLSLDARSDPEREPRLDGFNVIASPDYPFGGAGAKLALADAKRLGASAVAVVMFFWQENPASPNLVRGEHVTDEELRAAIRDAHALGLAVVLKPHVWVPKSWAGGVSMSSDADWRLWFANYQTELDRIAYLGQQEHAEALVVGTELAKTSQRPEWDKIIGSARNIFSGRLLYVAHNTEEAEKVPFWRSLDAVSVSLYPPLGADEDRAGRRAKMAATVDRLDALAARARKTIIVGEIGLRSAQGAAAKPWQSVEERASTPDLPLQAEVLADWLTVLKRPSIAGTLIWCWFTNPNAGGPGDTDFTVQGKPAEQTLRCAWTGACEQPAGANPK